MGIQMQSTLLDSFLASLLLHLLVQGECITFCRVSYEDNLPHIRRLSIASIEADWPLSKSGGPAATAVLVRRLEEG